jgi:hypothetical protein
MLRDVLAGASTRQKAMLLAFVMSYVVRAFCGPDAATLFTTIVIAAWVASLGYEYWKDGRKDAH